MKICFYNVLIALVLGCQFAVANSNDCTLSIVAIPYINKFPNGSMLAQPFKEHLVTLKKESAQECYEYAKQRATRVEASTEMVLTLVPTTERNQILDMSVCADGSEIVRVGNIVGFKRRTSCEVKVRYATAVKWSYDNDSSRHGDVSNNTGIVNRNIQECNPHANANSGQFQVVNDDCKYITYIWRSNVPYLNDAQYIDINILKQLEVHQINTPAGLKESSVP